MALDRKTTVNEVLKAHPEAVALLNRLGLDTCCGGSLPLEEAAREAGQDPKEVLRALEEFLKEGR
ncbi:hypothetical protein YIM1640_14360 [Thermus oshimai]|uniref:Regulator of cell morphogenesis and NO signaling n=1 Tax=Thermus oshimai JL-2 TaxID=751945 RepID=K7R581_THEOS|nr:DUF542 domain-containing protein [Thermus oshimai]AFV76109.1 regulator of cell morphogenesis and NO signaling [Thermus oshimai JL-2]